jgi:hypothetical protein
LQETELRTLKASAEDIAAKFDEAVAVLAGKRLDVQSEVRACGPGLGAAIAVVPVPAVIQPQHLA